MSDIKVKGIRFINHYNRGDAQHIEKYPQCPLIKPRIKMYVAGHCGILLS